MNYSFFLSCIFLVKACVSSHAKRSVLHRKSLVESQQQRYFSYTFFHGDDVSACDWWEYWFSR